MIVGAAIEGSNTLLKIVQNCFVQRIPKGSLKSQKNYNIKWRAQVQKVITSLFVKIELLVPMCSVTPLVSWNQTIFSNKKPFVSLIGIYCILYCVSFVKIINFLFQKALTLLKLNIFCSKRD